MNILVFDTETTGLVPNRNDEPEHATLDKWPHIVQFSAVLYDASTNVVLDVLKQYVRLPPGITIPLAAFNAHHISDDMCEQYGIELFDVFCQFFQMLERADVLVAHNMMFDRRVVVAELMRMTCEQSMTPSQVHIVNEFLNKLKEFTNQVCTMVKYTKLCAIPTPKGYKWPSLLELHKTIYNTVPGNLHDALNDTLVTLRCYMKVQYNVDPIEISPTFREYSAGIYV